MAKEPVSNHELAIVTAGTKHVARTRGETDICQDPATKEIRGFENEVPSKRLGDNKTTRTMIDGHPIMIWWTCIGPPSDPIHEPHTISVNNGGYLYRQQAKATDHSPDVTAEDHLVVRTNDPTTQNYKNTEGYIDGSQLSGDETTEEDFLKMKCSMEKLDGYSKDRSLGRRYQTSRKWDYLEILANSEVEFVSERWDRTYFESPIPTDTTCQLEPKHTLWKATRSGAWKFKKTVTGSGKKFKVDKKLTGLAGFVTQGLSSTDTNLSTPQTMEAGPSGSRQLGQGRALSATWWQCMQFAAYSTKPCYIEVVASACVGERKATLRVFPDKPMVFELKLGRKDPETYDARSTELKPAGGLLTKLKKLTGLADLVAKYVSIGDVELEFGLLTHFSLKLEIAFQHCTKESTRMHRWRSRSHIGMAFALVVDCPELIRFSITLKIPVASTAAKAVPLVGWAISKFVKWVEKKSGQGLFLNFFARVAGGLSTKIGQDQDGDFTHPGTSTAATISPEIGAELELVLVVAKIKAGVKAHGKVTLGLLKPTQQRYYMRAKMDGGVATTFYFEGYKTAKSPAFVSKKKGSGGVAGSWDAFSWSFEAFDSHFIEK